MLVPQNKNVMILEISHSHSLQARWSCCHQFIFYVEWCIHPAEYDGIIGREQPVGGQKFMTVTWECWKTATQTPITAVICNVFHLNVFIFQPSPF